MQPDRSFTRTIDSIFDAAIDSPMVRGSTLVCGLNVSSKNETQHRSNAHCACRPGPRGQLEADSKLVEDAEQDVQGAETKNQHIVVRGRIVKLNRRFPGRPKTLFRCRDCAPVTNKATATGTVNSQPVRAKKNVSSRSPRQVAVLLVRSVDGNQDAFASVIRARHDAWWTEDDMRTQVPVNQS